VFKELAERGSGKPKERSEETGGRDEPMSIKVSFVKAEQCRSDLRNGVTNVFRDEDRLKTT
jgi:hypothetical protein